MPVIIFFFILGKDIFIQFYFSERIAENATNAIHDLGRRDSLSLNVEYIRVNISRTRKLETHSEPGGEAGAGGAVKGEQQIRCNAVRFSGEHILLTISYFVSLRFARQINVSNLFSYLI